MVTIKMPLFKRYLYLYLLFLIAIVSFFVVLVYLVDVRAVRRQEEQFNRQQLVQTLIVRKTIQQLIDAGLKVSKYIADVGLSEKKITNLVFDKNSTPLKYVYPSIVSVVEFDDSINVTNIACIDTCSKKVIGEIATRWIEQYREDILPNADSFVPPFFITKEHQYMGCLFFREANNEQKFVVVVLDLASVLSPYIGALKSGNSGSGYALDDLGTVLYDREEEIIGRNVFDGMHAGYSNLEVLDRRIVVEDTGMASYSFTVTRGQKVFRKLIAWNTVKFKGRRIIIALSAADAEQHAPLEELRNFYIMLGGILALLLAVLTFVLLRKKQHQELLESEKRFRQLASATWEGIIIHRGGMIRLANEQFYKIFGYEEEELSGKQYLSLFFSSDTMEFIESKVYAGDFNFYETVGIRKDGSVFPLEVRVRETELHGEVVRVAALRDVSEYKKIVEAISAGERNYREIFNATNDAIVIQEIKNNNFIDVNTAALEMFGYSYDEMLQLQFSDLGYSALHLFGIDGMQSGKNPAPFGLSVVSWKGKRKDGSFFWCEATVRKSNIGGKERVLTVIRDITARMQYEEELRVSEQYYKSLFENTGTATVIFDAQGGIRSCNSRFEQLSGYPRDAIENKMHWVDFVQSCSFSQMEHCHIQRINGDPAASEDYDFSLLDKHGVRKFVQIEFVSIPGTSDRLASFLDITERIQFQRDLAALNQSLERIVASRTEELAKKAADLEQANARLTELDELKSNFVSSVSHELRTPLTSIRGFAKIIQRDFEKFFHLKENAPPEKLLRSERIVSNLGIVLREGERLTRLINDMLDLNKIESGKMEWYDEWVDPAEAVNMSIDAVRGQFEGKEDVELLVEMEESLPQLFINPDRLQQVLINLLNNAAKFTENGEVKLAVSRAPDSLIFSVSDTGMGIPEDELKDIFIKFHKSRLPIGGPFPSRGTGLGLAICKEIISHYKGDIKVDSANGKGSTFTFRIPLT